VAESTKEKERLWELVEKTNKEKPRNDDIKELRALLQNPELLHEVGSFTEQNISYIVNSPGWKASSRELVKAQIYDMKKEMGYYLAPQTERMLIDAVMLTWLRWQTWETHYTQMNQGEGMTLTKAEFWEKRLSAAQGRYLRAVETLARVRKLISPVLQVNIANEGGQQVNVAGDLMKS
jgi:hypothetical protein